MKRGGRCWTTAGRFATATTRGGGGGGVPTFAEVAERTMELHRDGWEAGSTVAEQWAATFRLHAVPLLDKPVDQITSADVLGCLAPIWTSKPAAGRKAKRRISAVFRWCIGKNLRPDNPLDPAAVALPRANGNAPTHYRVLPHREVASALRAIHGVRYIHPSAMPCVEMIALTAVRAGEARGARVDDPRVEDEGRSRVLCSVEHGRARRPGAGASVGSRLVTGVSFEDRRGVAEERAGAGALASRDRLDSSRVPLERAVLAGRDRGPGGSRRSLPRPRPEKPGRLGVSALRPAGAPRRGHAGVEQVCHVAIGDRLGEELRGRFGPFSRHFGVSAGRGIAQDRRSPVSEG